MKTSNKIRGFTLIELLIVIAIMALISIPTVTSYITSNDNQNVLAAANQFADILRRAHIFSREITNNRVWSVRSEAGLGSYSLVSQTISGVQTVEKTYSLPAGVKFNNSFTIQFDRGTGVTSANTSIIMQSLTNRQTQISIGTTGTVNVGP
jgi:prepilin-type N-terminal cleavage/methylation domain-containing protein